MLIRIGIILILVASSFIFGSFTNATSDAHGVSLTATTTTTTVHYGLTIFSKSNLTLNSVTLDSKVVANQVSIWNTKKEVLATSSISGSVANFNLDLNYNETYVITVGNTNYSSYTYAYNAAGSNHPVNGTNIDWVADGYYWQGGNALQTYSSNDWYSIISIDTTDNGTSSSGTTTINYVEVGEIMENFYNFAFIILAGVFFFVVAWWWYKMLK